MKDKIYFLVGYYGQGNVGDDAILSAFLSFFRKDGREFSWLPSSEKKRKIRRFFGILKGIRKADGVILVGGNLLQNETSNLSLLFYLLVIRYALFRQKSLTVFGGIGKVTGAFWQRQVGRAIQKSDCLYLRSSADIKTATALCEKNRRRVPKTTFFPDVTLFLPPLPKKEKKRGILILKKQKNIDIHTKLIALCKRQNLPIVLVGMCNEDDEYLKKLGAITQIPVFLPRTYQEVQILLSDAVFCVSERFHGGIFSLLSDTPCFLEVSNEKNHGLYTDVCQSAKKKGVIAPLFGYHNASVYADGFSAWLFSFFQKKIGGISASDFDAVRQDLTSRQYQVINLP